MNARRPPAAAHRDRPGARVLGVTRRRRRRAAHRSCGGGSSTPRAATRRGGDPSGSAADPDDATQRWPVADQRRPGRRRRLRRSRQRSSRTPGRTEQLTRGHPADRRRVQGIQRDVHAPAVHWSATSRTATINCPCHGSDVQHRRTARSPAARRRLRCAPIAVKVDGARSSQQPERRRLTADRVVGAASRLGTWPIRRRTDRRRGRSRTSPGVYRFRDEHGRVIYVGKAKSLRSRLSSYFQDISGAAPAHPDDGARRPASVEWTVVSTEVEALQLEYTWIKEFDPRFNVKYRDDKSYP